MIPSKLMLALALRQSLVPVDSAPADAPTVAVEGQGCGDLDVMRLQRLLNLELAAVVDHSSPRDALVLSVTCKGEAIELAVTDPRTGRALTREVPAPEQAHPDPERIVALTTSELFATAWVDLLGAPPAQRSADEEPTAAQPSAAPDPAPPRETPPASPAPVPSRRDAIVIDVDGKGRHLTRAAVGVGGVAVGYGLWWHPRWGVFCVAGFEAGRTHRERGNVVALIAWGGVRVAWRSRQRRRTRARLDATVAATWGSLSGDPVPGVRGSRVGGIGGEAVVRAGPQVDLGRVRLGFHVLGGWGIAGPTGRVTSEDPVRVRGLLVGGGLDIEVPMIGPR